jgi:TPR repeat protein
MCYKDGEGVAMDTNCSLQLLIQAAEKGHSNAQFTLACAYKTGEGVPKDLNKSFEWFFAAGIQGEFSLFSQF